MAGALFLCQRREARDAGDSAIRRLARWDDDESGRPAPPERRSAILRDLAPATFM